MNSHLKSENILEDISLLSKKELAFLVFESSIWDELTRQIVLVKCAIKKSPKDIETLKKIIDEALSYERPNRDPSWGSYDTYLHEIKKSIISLDKDLSVPELKKVLVYLRDRAEDDDVIAEFEEDGEWSMAIDDINEHISELEK